MNMFVDSPLRGTYHLIIYERYIKDDSCNKTQNDLSSFIYLFFKRCFGEFELNTKKLSFYRQRRCFELNTLMLRGHYPHCTGLLQPYILYLIINVICF